MDYIDWCKNLLRNNQSEVELQEKIKEIVETNLKDKDYYVLEKFIKSYCEPIMNYENLCFFQKGVHPSQMNALSVLQEDHLRIFGLFEDIRNLVSFEINNIDDNFSIEDVILTDKNNEKYLKETLESLMLISNANSSLSRLMLKKYYKNIFYLEEFLLLKNNLQLDLYSEPVIYCSKLNDINECLNNVNSSIHFEIKRQFRHFLVFINEI